MRKISLEPLKINRVIRYFILADLIFFAGWGLINPIFAVFVSDRVNGENLKIIGIAVAIYWLTKSLIQVPISIFLDKHKGEKDDFYVLIFGLILAGIASACFLLVHSAAGIYAAIFLQGVAFGSYVPSWSAIFSRHLDENSRSLNWSLDSTGVGLGSGIAAFFGGIVATIWGFPAVFILTSVLSFAAVLVLLNLPKLILPRPIMPEGVLREHKPLS